MGLDRRSRRADGDGADPGGDARGPRDLRGADERRRTTWSVRRGSDAAERSGRNRGCAGVALQGRRVVQRQAPGVLEEQAGRNAVQGLASGRGRADAALRGVGQRARR